MQYCIPTGYPVIKIMQMHDQMVRWAVFLRKVILRRKKTPILPKRQLTYSLINYNNYLIILNLVPIISELNLPIIYNRLL